MSKFREGRKPQPEAVLTNLAVGIAGGSNDVRTLCSSLRCMIEYRLWETRGFERMVDLITAKHSKDGFASTVQIVGAFAATDRRTNEMFLNQCRIEGVDVMDEVRKAKTQLVVDEAKKPNKSKNLYSDNHSPRVLTAQVRRMCKEKPALLAEVENGKLTLNAALIRAGIKPKRASLELTPPNFARAVHRHFTLDQRKQIAAWIVQKEQPAEIATKYGRKS